jgi:hypothetical protein
MKTFLRCFLGSSFKCPNSTLTLPFIRGWNARVSVTTVSEREQTRKNMGYRLGETSPAPSERRGGPNGEKAV